jgi:hypothetical protein
MFLIRLPMSHVAVDETIKGVQDWMRLYTKYLHEQNITIRPRMVILDVVYSGRSLEAIHEFLKYYDRETRVLDPYRPPVEIRKVWLFDANNLEHIWPRLRMPSLFDPILKLKMKSAMLMSDGWPRLIPTFDVHTLTQDNAEKMFQQAHVNQFTCFPDSSAKLAAEKAQSHAEPGDKPDLPVLSKENYQENSVARLILEKCATPFFLLTYFGSPSSLYADGTSRLTKQFDFGQYQTYRAIVNLSLFEPATKGDEIHRGEKVMIDNVENVYKNGSYLNGSTGHVIGLDEKGCYCVGLLQTVTDRRAPRCVAVKKDMLSIVPIATTSTSTSLMPNLDIFSRKNLLTLLLLLACYYFHTLSK